MNRAKGTDRVWMPGFAGDLLKNDPNAIKDSSELRKLLATEDDPSRFFLLSKFSTSFIIRGENFIPEESRMLFRHGRVAEQTNNTTYSKVLGDVSAYTYESIVNTLGFLHAPFDEATMLPNGGQIPYPEKIQILAKWLRENWPGCENLGNAETLSVESVHEPKRHVESETRPKKPLPLQTNEEAANQPVAIKLWWLAITVGIIVLAVLVAWLKRKSNAP
jgi:hypothetical protein